MLKLGVQQPLGFGSFSFFAILSGLTLLMGANYAAPGCTGPEVQRCDYVASAKAALAASNSRDFFSTDREIDVFDHGSSVVVQHAQITDWVVLDHSPAVLIDKKSCKPCEIRDIDPDVADQASLIMRIPAEDKIAAAELVGKYRRWQLGLE